MEANSPLHLCISVQLSMTSYLLNHSQYSLKGLIFHSNICHAVEAKLLFTCYLELNAPLHPVGVINNTGRNDELIRTHHYECVIIFTIHTRLHNTQYKKTHLIFI